MWALVCTDPLTVNSCYVTDNRFTDWLEFKFTKKVRLSATQQDRTADNFASLRVLERAPRSRSMALTAYVPRRKRRVSRNVCVPNIDASSSGDRNYALELGWSTRCQLSYQGRYSQSLPQNCVPLKSNKTFCRVTNIASSCSSRTYHPSTSIRLYPLCTPAPLNFNPQLT